jgi:hypothetical protein
MAHPCGGCLEFGSGEVSTSTGQEAVAQAPLGPRVGTGVVGRSWMQEEGRLGGGHGATAELQRHERKKGATLYSCEHALGVLLCHGATRSEERGVRPAWERAHG